MLIDRELVGVFGDVTGDEEPVFAQRAAEELASREAKIDIREREVDADERGCASGVSDCDVGRMHLRPESDRLKLCQSSRHVNRRVAPRSDATNAAPAGQASSTSTATAWPAAEHNAGYGRWSLSQSRGGGG